ncbi:hypothetical protein [Rhabdothermincola sp.]|jgi:hypothetical protein|uniref:hypothetical protein n=1 Tax=Rhabdothermincola sp. TaxID=2820405 RepID=UPI002FE3F6E7
MATVTKDQVFKRHQKVVAAVDLPHVPAGTPGRVLYVAGVTWIRYHVLFDNGQVVSSLDATQLMSREDWERKQYEERIAARKASARSTVAA